jgi:CHAT domain-containing protein
MNNLRETEEKFLVNLLNILVQSQRNSQIIYPRFQANLDKLTVDFAQRLRAWGEPQIKDSPPEESHTLAIVLLWLSNLILEFPLGDKTANIAIAKTGYECALIFYTRERNPLAWAEITVNLGIAYEEDPQADPVQKWEDAINCYQKASQVFTRTTNPERWASIQDNLGNAYRNRQQGEAEINLQQAIQYHQKALEIFTPEKNPRLSGMSQHNLGSDYLALSRLNIANNEQCLESAIDHYDQALKTLKKEVYPDLWAMNQLSLGKAYSVRLRGNPYQNHEKAQQHYENALSVYTPETYPEYYQQAKAGQERLNQLKIDSNRETQQESSFIVQVLKLTAASLRDVEKVFPFLEKNLDKLNQNLIQKLREFIVSLEEQNNPAIIYEAMMGLYFLSHSLMIFPQGNREINLDIAIAGWQMFLRFFKEQSENIIPQNIIVDIQIRLGFAFHEKYENKLGDLYVNIEETIKCFEDTLSLDPAQNYLYLGRESLADIQNKLGLAYFNKNKIKADPNNIEKAIRAYESALKDFPENSLELAMVQNNLGYAYRAREGNELINCNKAIKCYEKAENISKQDTHSTIWADIQISLSLAYYDKAMLGYPSSAEDIKKAIKYAENAEKVYNDSKKSKYPQRWALVKYRLGIAYSDNNKENHAENIEKAIVYLNQALDVWNQQDYPYDRAQTKQVLGVVYFQRCLAGRGDQIANLKLSIQYLEAALKGFHLEKYSVDYAETQRFLAQSYRNIAKYIEPGKNLKKAIAIATSTVSILINNRQNKKLIKAYKELANCYKDMGGFVGENRKENLTTAIESYQNALNLTSRETHPFDWADIKNSLGNAYKHHGQYQEAMNCFQETLQLHTREAFPTDYMKTLTNLGKANADYKQFTDAFDCYKLAINTLEDDLIDKLLADDDAKRKLGEEWTLLYQLMVAVCLKLGKQNCEYYARAWEYVERSKARRLVELFGQTKPANISSDDVWKEFQDLRNQVTNERKWIEDQEKSRILSGEIMSEEPEELKNRKNSLTNLKKQLDEKITAHSISSDTQRVQHTPFSEIGDKLSDDHTVIIQWYLLEADQKFCAFIYTRQSSQPYVWESSLEDLENLQQWHEEYYFSYGQFIWIMKNYQVFDSFEELKQTMISALTSIEESPEEILSTEKERDSMLEYVTNLKKTDQWIDELSDRLNRLAEILHIDELLNYLPPNCQQVILIPHRYLHLFPIHALPVSQQTWKRFNPEKNANAPTNPCLLDCFEKGVRYSPSCQALMAIQNRKRPNFNQLFAIQNPTKDLNYAELEVKAVLNYFDSNSRKVFANEKANKANITLADYLNNAHCIHFSCHGTFNPESPIESGLILANQEILTLGEIFGFDLRQCRLVVLSACETGMIDPSSITDEYIGLPSAFLYAGSPSVVSSLWRVNDQSTAFLMIKLYEILKNQPQNQKNVAVALKEAQLWLRDATVKQLRDLTSGLNLEQNYVEQINKKFDWYEPNDTPFDSLYHWASFCAIGQ